MSELTCPNCGNQNINDRPWKPGKFYILTCQECGTGVQTPNLHTANNLFGKDTRPDKLQRVRDEIDNLRLNINGNFKDKRYQGQRGIDQSDALREALLIIDRIAKE